MTSKAERDFEECFRQVLNSLLDQSTRLPEGVFWSRPIRLGNENNYLSLIVVGLGKRGDPQEKAKRS